MAFAVQGGLFVSSASAFTFDDIHYWIGEGTNQAAVVLDWNNGQPNSSIAYGVRWNGASTNMTEMLKRIAHDDRRLNVAMSPGYYGTSLDGFGYDVDNDGGFFDLAQGLATDADDFVCISGDGVWPAYYYWAATFIHDPVFRTESNWDYCEYGIDGSFLENGVWYAFKHIVYDMETWISENDTPSPAVAAETPFAFQVVSHATGGDAGLFNKVEAVLGAPARVSRKAGSYPAAAVTPTFPAWLPEQVFTLAKDKDNAGGYVTVCFDHKVFDDPLNPYGLDFIVFGNTICQKTGGSAYDDPNAITITVPSYTVDEPGLVEVSQDGTNWVSAVDWPSADTFAPTFGLLYDANEPDTALFQGNVWWGGAADATLPVDPTLSATDFVGKTLAQMAVLYNGSAGGTGFDISALNLAPDGETGRKWIKYIRVTAREDYDPDEVKPWTDIDAFADVSPALPYDNWVRENYAWMQLPDKAVTGKRAIAANGKPNFYNAALGTAPDAPPVESFPVQHFEIENGRAVFQVPAAAYAYDAFRVGVASGVDGKYNNVLPVWEGMTNGNASAVLSLPIDPAAPSAFYKIGLSAE